MSKFRVAHTADFFEAALGAACVAVLLEGAAVAAPLFFAGALFFTVLPLAICFTLYGVAHRHGANNGPSSFRFRTGRIAEAVDWR